MFQLRTYIGVALAIALVAFALGQLVEGLGTAFVVLASTMWTAYVAHRHKRLNLRR